MVLPVLKLSALVGICGFTCAGIRGNSYASERQSLLGNVERGSCFACCQSTGKA